MENPSGQLPENLAEAHAVIEAQREMLGKHPTRTAFLPDWGNRRLLYRMTAVGFGGALGFCPSIQFHGSSSSIRFAG